ncbi:MAG: hypothetical protein KAX49_15760 [Halanaerobiales bacterium]|nr:hypothetical protein [Halanaerobiales bacterium]
MAKFVCDSGTLAIVGTGISGMCLNNVSLDISTDTVNYICMGDASWQSAAASTKSWTCSFETALDDTVGLDLANTIGSSGAFTFDTVDGLGYTGTAIITSISLNAPADDYATVSWEATGTGAISEA